MAEEQFDRSRFTSETADGGDRRADGPAPASTDARPYRSHRIPACDFCHRRRSRCQRARLDEPCALCVSRKKQCINRITSHVQQKPRASANAVTRTPPQRWDPSLTSPRVDVGMGGNVGASNSSNASAAAMFSPAHSNSRMGPARNPMDSMLAATGDSGHSSHIVAPAIASDVQMLEEYLYPQDNGAVSHVHPNPYSVYSADPRNPVVYLKVPKQRSKSSRGNAVPGYKEWEIMENILYPLGPMVLDLYFDTIHPAFPLLDETAVKKAYQEGTLPYALICEIYAVSLISWDLSPSIMAIGRSRPDIQYLWNTTVKAMHEDFLNPSISTVLACILDLLGRPITSITYNAINVGSAVALAQSLGLNRNPANWKLDRRQKNLRVKTWWALLIHDTWASLCHGTPGHIHREQWDVDLPDISTLVDETTDPSAEVRANGARIFIVLCRLTKLLGEVLSVVYALPSAPLERTLRVLRRTDAYVDDLQDSLPPWLALGEDSFDRRQPGALNLQLSFLAVKMCICRTALQATRLTDDSESRYYQSRCIKAGNALIDAVVSMPAEEVTTVFWLPYIAYHFASAATLMMRCALEEQDERTAMGCIDSARKLIDHLEGIKTQTKWDLADICLNQCETTVKHMSDKHNLSMWRRRKANTNSTSLYNVDMPSADGDLSMSLAADSTRDFSSLEGLTESERFDLDVQEHLTQELYFPGLWQTSRF